MLCSVKHKPLTCRLYPLQQVVSCNRLHAHAQVENPRDIEDGIIRQIGSDFRTVSRLTNLVKSAEINCKIEKNDYFTDFCVSSLLGRWYRCVVSHETEKVKTCMIIVCIAKETLQLWVDHFNKVLTSATTLLWLQFLLHFMLSIVGERWKEVGCESSQRDMTTRYNTHALTTLRL